MIPVTSELLQWMDAHKGEDFAKLRLKYSRQQFAMTAIMQMECRKKAASKLPETLQHSLFTFPSTLSAEQCTSDMLARYHASMIAPGAKVLDMTCGLGIDAFHICATASSVTGIDIDSETVRTAAHNADVLNLNNFKAICADSTEYLRKTGNDAYDVIFIDPARRSGGHKVMLMSDCNPDVTKFLPAMLRAATQIIIKASPMLDIKNTVNLLSNVKQIHAIGTATECKELLLVCERGWKESPSVYAVTVTNGKPIVIESPYNGIGNKAENATYLSELIDGQYLYEPWPAIMKAGIHTRISMIDGICKLAPDTHLYASESLHKNFPGKKMRILRVWPYHKKNLSEISVSYPKANVSTRSFPLQAPQLAKTLKIQEGGDLMLYGLSLCGKRQYYIVVCEQVKV